MQLGHGGQVPVGVGRLDVAEVGGQHRQRRRDVRAVAVPVERVCTAKRVAQVVEPRVDGLAVRSPIGAVISPEDASASPRRSARPVTDTKNRSTHGVGQSRSRVAA